MWDKQQIHQAQANLKAGTSNVHVNLCRYHSVCICLPVWNNNMPEPTETLTTYHTGSHAAQDHTPYTSNQNSMETTLYLLTRCCSANSRNTASINGHGFITKISQISNIFSRKYIMPIAATNHGHYLHWVAPVHTKQNPEAQLKWYKGTNCSCMSQRNCCGL